jgi:hypothetical protein
MATKKEAVLDAPAAVTDDATPVEPVETPTRSRRGLKLAAFIAAAVVAAGLLFGGGVLLGANLPGAGGRPDFSQGQLPGGGQPPHGGPQGDQQRGGPQGQQQPEDTEDN